MSPKTFARLLVPALLIGSVNAASAVTLELGSASGQPGSLVRFDVILNPICDGVVYEVGGTDNTVTVGTSMSIDDCRIADQFSAFSQVAFEPDGCETNPDVDCSSARVLILNDVGGPIPANTLLYSCDVRIAFDAKEGIDPITCSDALASSPDGQAYDGTVLACMNRRSVPCENDEDCAEFGGTCSALPETGCNNGSIEVSGVALPTPTLVPVGVLASDISETDDTIPLVDSSLFGGSGTIEIGNERITYRAKVGDDLTEAQRGKSGTTPAAHEAGTRVDLIASNSGGAGGGRGCAIGSDRERNAAWLLVAAAMLAFARRRSARD